MALDVDLVAPDRILYSGEAEMVICRTPAGEIAFLTGHVPFLGALGIGVVRVHTTDSGEVKAAVHGGFVEVKDDRVVVLSDVAELPEQIDVERARRAQQEAEQQVAQATDEDEKEELQAKARRAEVRLEVAEQA